MIYNFELEKQLLAGLLKEPESLAEISNFISNSDFYSDLFDYFLNSDDSNFYQTIEECTDNEYITNALLKIS